MFLERFVYFRKTYEKIPLLSTAWVCPLPKRSWSDTELSESKYCVLDTQRSIMKGNFGVLVWTVFWSLNWCFFSWPWSSQVKYRLFVTLHSNYFPFYRSILFFILWYTHKLIMSTRQVFLLTCLIIMSTRQILMSTGQKISSPLEIRKLIIKVYVSIIINCNLFHFYHLVVYFWKSFFFLIW